MDLTEEATIWSQLDRPTLLVGNPDALLEKFPAMAGQFEACQELTLCGTLNQDDPAAELAERIANTQTQRLWIIGGDGTINLVAECAIRFGLAIPCWLTPAGTANDLVRSLTDYVQRNQPAQTEIATSNSAAPLTTDVRVDPSDQLPMLGTQSHLPSANLRAPHLVLPASAATATGDASIAVPVAIDVMQLELDDGKQKKACANMLTLGTSARNTQHVTSEIKARWGALAYLTQAWRAMTDLEPFNLRLTVGDSQTITATNILNVFIANGAYCGGGHRVAPEAQLDDERFNVILLRNGTTPELAHLTAAFLAGTHLEHALIEHFATNRLTIEFDTESPITLDGEPFSARKIVMQAKPHALSLQLIGA